MPNNQFIKRRITAYQLYRKGFRQADIARKLGVTSHAVTRWKKEDLWDDEQSAKFRMILFELSCVFGAQTRKQKEKVQKINFILDRLNNELKLLKSN